MPRRTDTSGARRKFTAIRGAIGGQARQDVKTEVQRVVRRIASVTPVRTGRLKRSTRAIVSVRGNRTSVVVGWLGPHYGVYVEARTGIIDAHRDEVRDAMVRGLRKSVRRTTRRLNAT